MRVLAIGDIHGCLQAFDSLLALVQPTEEDLLVPLGDYIDRGPNSRGVLQRLLELRRTHRLMPLAGNHEQMLLEARYFPNIFEGWLASGGEQTLLSYGLPATIDSLMSIPQQHWEFLEDCVDWLETERWLFVHANLEAGLPLDRQPISALRWEKFIDPQPHCSGKTMICGHTRQLRGVPRNVGYAICIDTWAYGEGWLTCLDAQSGRVWQANERGHQRESWIGDYLEEATAR